MRGVLWVGGNGCGWFLRLCVERMLCSMRGVGLVGNRNLFSWMGGWFDLG